MVKEMVHLTDKVNDDDLLSHAPIRLDLNLISNSLIISDIYVVMSSQGLECEDMKFQTESQPKKTCADCCTTKTPLWRGGPAGPKSLCNACGIKNMKKRRAMLGLNRTEDKKTEKCNRQVGDSLKRRLLALGKQVLSRRSMVEKQRKKLGEEEQAALLLMALSCGSVYA